MKPNKPRKMLGFVPQPNLLGQLGDFCLLAQPSLPSNKREPMPCVQWIDWRMRVWEQLLQLYS
ncbi:hypothetical protein [Nostoc sp.]|uniref:hypothetical protein n=1 Tax=Nostoc sp. TaxID=1180 RepID=UPI002FFD55EA